eukprot:CAMPEP_0183336884 /NCGR_PEP_ID=MMETSP0164_2-20130417/4730_1 /TAXON_ID=221442 /ORGANISM="Coccolithus pelagicus ssp braarudi, Strain PLY182g" /LENGTH=75 /DNA_ID=CAMNT_0025506495 /DNA_START=681 /DNA_END=905 /DNA_ORIENTATION=-
MVRCPHQRAGNDVQMVGEARGGQLECHSRDVLAAPRAADHVYVPFIIRAGRCQPLPSSDSRVGRPPPGLWALRLL